MSPAESSSLVPPPSLRDIQRWIKTRIQPSEHPSSDSDQPIRFLNAQRGTPGEQRMIVYAGGYLIRMREALAQVYEAVRHILGEESFAQLATAYAKWHPSNEYNLNVAGRRLPEFLAHSPLTERLPFLPDLAILEWVVCRAFHAFEQPPIAPSRLTAIPQDVWERMSLRFQPSVSVVKSAWPILDIWAARTQPRQAIDIDLAGRPQDVLVRREGLQVRCELITPSQHHIMAGLLEGKSLGEVCAELTAHGHEDASSVSVWFAGWMSQGLICDVIDAVQKHPDPV